MNYGFKDLKVYKLAYKLTMEIFELTKTFPKEETYSLTDQIRRSSRGVGANTILERVTENGSVPTTSEAR